MKWPSESVRIDVLDAAWTAFMEGGGSNFERMTRAMEATAELVAEQCAVIVEGQAEKEDWPLSVACERAAAAIRETIPTPAANIE